MRTELCVAKWRIGVESPIGGSFTTQIEAVQYTSSEYRQHLSVMGVCGQATVEKASAGIMPLTERFFRSLKYEYLHYEAERSS
ncbi:hypothetical protein [Candidatus Williamhamiltonella defendens]|uniref:hypothetical protein n=1 Tax=Candidatus Williamhamiltonella defendens TaxID=138072 RepID=UPI0011D0ED62|nr:hypothetical protein [Candidatus Hamiltonella defensa]